MDIAFAYVLLAACAANLTSFLGSPFALWFPLVLLATIVVILVAAMIYMLSPLAGRNDLRVWSRVKIYDVLSNLVFVFIFLSFSGLLCTIGPSAPLLSANLLPHSTPSTPGCVPGGTNPPNTIPSLPASGDNLFSLADCNIYLYNYDLMQFSVQIYYTILVFSLSPQVTVFPSVVVDPSHARQTIGTGITFNLNFLPIQIAHHYITPLMGTLFAVILASFVQQILVNAALPLFGIFMTIGLIARSFGVTRSFGGAMIAFGIGVGFVYPLLVTITYGFLNYSVAALPSSSTSVVVGGIHGIGHFFTPDVFWDNLVAILKLGVGAGSLGTVIQDFLNVFGDSLVYGGFMALGLTLIPLLNLVVVDAFIVDFSKAIGERMDFLSLLTRII